MRKLLVVDCCIRKEESRTKKILERFLSAAPSDCEVERLVLTEENLAPLMGDFFEQRQRLLETGDFSHPRFRYAKQFANADLVDGITFGANETGLVGLCRGTDLVFLTARGGFYTDDPMEMGSRYLDALHTFFGFDRYHCVAADGMDVVGFDGKASLEEACKKAEALAASL